MTEHTVSRVCTNCGAERTGPFCSQCGQNDKHYDRSLWRVLGDLLRETFDFQSRASRTFVKLFRHPGAVSQEFRHDRRASYVSPIRMYLFTSLLFFLVVAIIGEVRSDPVLGGIFLNDGFDAESSEQTTTTTDFTEALERLESVTNESTRQLAEEILTRSSESNTRPMLESLLLSVGEPQDVPEIARVALRTAVKVLHDPEELGDELQNNLPLIMVILLPWLVFASYLFNFTKRIRVVHHLVFCMHVFTAVFVVWTFKLILSEWIVTHDLTEFVFSTVMFLYIYVHIYLAYKNFYSDSHIIALLKYIPLLLFTHLVGLVAFASILLFTVVNL